MASTNTMTSNADAWRFDGQATPMTSVKLPSPFATGTIAQHPRLPVYASGTGNLLYAMALDGPVDSATYRIIATTLDASSNSTTWTTPVTIVPSGVVFPRTVLADGRGIRIANPYSFDVGLNAAGAVKVRVMYEVTDSGGTVRLRTRECAPDLSGCADAPWSTVGNAADDAIPSLRYNGVWAASWRRKASGTSTLATIAGLLRESGGTTSLDEKVLLPPVNPCSAYTDIPAGEYYGDYDELAILPSNTFFAAYTVSGPGCRFAGPWSSDQHVGSSVFGF